MPCFRCLISALTQAGGGDLLLRFASSVQSCCGEGGALQADVAVCGEHSPCSGQAACSFGGLSPGAACLFPPRRAAWVARGLCALSPGRGVPFPSAASGPGSQRFGALSTGAPRLFPWPQLAPQVGSQEVFRQEPGPVCRVGWGGFSGAEFAPFPPPLPPTSSRDGAALLWSFSVPLFCEPPVVCSGRSIFPSLSHSLFIYFFKF